MELEKIQLKRIISGSSKGLINANERQFKRNRLIYSIDKLISDSQLENLIKNSDIDCFYFDTSSFVNVKDYLKMIDKIRESCKILNKHISIIVELRCRKLKIENFLNSESVKLKKGTKIKIVYDGKQLSSSSQLIVRSKDFHKMVKIGDKIIINDNKASFSIYNILENEVVRSKTRKNSREGQKVKNESLFTKKNCNFERNKDKKFRTCVIDEKIERIQYEASRNPKLQNNNGSHVGSGTLDEISRKSFSKVATFQNLENDLEVIEEERKKNNKEQEELINLIFDDEDEENKLPEIARNHEFDVPHFDVHQYFTAKLTSSLELLNLNNQLNEEEESLANKETKKKSKKKVEVFCKVDYDCEINNSSFIYIPNLNYKEYEIDLLSTREIAEIALLEEKEIDYLSISLCDMEDIESLKEILSENTKLKLIFSIPDLKTLEHLDEFLKYASGILVSRTFHVTGNINTQTDIILTKKLLQKCRTQGIPVFSFLDLNQKLISQRKQKLNELKDVMYNIIDGMDGFIVSIFSKDVPCIEIHKTILKMITNFYLEIENNNLFLKEYIDRFKEIKNLKDPLEIICSIIYQTSEKLKNSLIFYNGNSLEDIRIISKFRYNSGLICVSQCSEFLNKSRIYYGFETLKISNHNSVEDLEFSLKNQFSNKSLIIINNLKGKVGLKILV